MDPEGEAVTARHALRVQANTAEDKVRPAAAEQVSLTSAVLVSKRGRTMNSQPS